MIDNDAAERLREFLSTMQITILNEHGVPLQLQEKLVTLISAEGFNLVDELEGVVR
jgi:hypothetical protein